MSGIEGIDEVVISGFSGRFPESSNVEEFKSNLFNGVDMVNDDPRRWPTGLYDLPARIGKIKQENLENFDHIFFGVHQKQAEVMDPLLRNLLEVTHETIVDSGYNPQELRGSCTGVYVGAIASEAKEYWSTDPNSITGHELLGCFRSMFANRLSFTFNFTGPSYAVDTACSSSLFAMAQAFQDIQTGRCNAAIVAGINFILNPITSLMFHRIRMMSPDGACKAFDESANGYVRADGCVVVFLQKSKDARRIYSTVLNIRTNTDGAKDQGISYPNGEMQKQLMQETYQEISLSPHDVQYVEAHGTGTKAGVIDGRLKVVNRNIPWSGGIVAINNFGFGGVNTHVILKSNPKMKIIKPVDGYPRMAVVSGRTYDAVQVLLKDIEAHADDEEYLALVNKIHAKNIPLHNYRGYTVVSKDEPLHDIVEFTETKRPIWFVFSGIGSQWAHMAKELMKIEIFNRSIHRCAEVLRLEGVDLIHILTNLDETSFDTLHNFISIIAVQIALTDVLTHLGITPDGFVGHSVGELGCAYADGCLTLEQTILAAYWRGRSILDTDLISGTMAAVGLSWEECLKRLPEDIFPACHNSADNVTISGPTESINKFVEILQKEGVFAKIVNVSGIPFHSKYMNNVGPKLKKSLDKIIPIPKNRTDKWISTSIPQCEWNTALAKKSSADYHVNNLLSPVLFYEAIQHIPKNSICIEIAPHGLLQAILRRSLGKNVINLSLMKRNHDKNVQFLMSNIGKLYAAGAQPDVNKLFRPITYPVGRGTPMLNSKILWDHSQKWTVPYLGSSNTSKETFVEFDLRNEEDSFLIGHTIDGRVLFPAAGYISLAWRQFAKAQGSTPDRMSVIFENLVFHRATILPVDGSVKFGIKFLDSSGKFEICEGNSLATSGSIRIFNNIEQKESILDSISVAMNDFPLAVDDIYMELRMRGYDYNEPFKGLVHANPNVDTGKLKWINNNWISFIDTMFQFIILGQKSRHLKIPTQIEKVIINPNHHFQLAEKTPYLQNSVNDSEIRILTKDITMGPIESTYHLYLATDVLTHPNAKLILRNLRDSIKDDGFMCSEKEYLLLRPTFYIESQKIQVINVTEKNFDWLEKLKSSILKAESENSLLYIVCQGEELFGAIGFMNCLKYETGGNSARLFFIQDTNAPIFSITNPFYLDQIKKNLTLNVLKNGIWGSFRHLKLECQQNLPNQQVDHAFVNVLTKGDLSSLRWIEGPLSINRPELTDPDVEMCTVYYAPLNFRDIMLGSGKLSVDSLPKHLADEECVLGIEFSGRDSKGKRIMAMVPSKSLATSCVVRKKVLWPVPDSWTLEEASTVPCVYSTVYYCISRYNYALVMRGKMKKGETILIHAGSGGVGQAAISVALHAGLTVFTTVGSKEKREFLKKTFPQLTDRNIGNSRDCSFEEMIMRETKGRGVDLVLNSLADEKLQASVRCLALNGRFLEIGKFDLSNNSSLGMSIFLKNISFNGILLDQVLSSDDETINEIKQLIYDGIESGAVRPLPRTVFNNQEVEEAFRFMASGKHIGKVLIKLRNEEEEKKILPASKLISAIPRTYFYKEKTYIVVGGLGGFGLELIHWLISRGARNIVATSRSGIKSGYQSLMIRRWREKGVNVVVAINDLSTQQSAQQLLKDATKLGPVGGIFNTAVVLRDGFLENQQESDFRTVCLSKVDATKFLDVASRILCPDLDYFICFSSVSCGRGNIGQVNYGLANSAMERICEARQAAGYPGMAIQWGAIGDTGLILRDLGNNNTNIGGTLPQRIVSCLETMDCFMKHPYPILASMVIADKKKMGNDRINISTHIGNILGFKNLKKISFTSTLADLGMDSLMREEIKQTLERNYDLVLNAQEIRQLTFEKLKTFEDEKA
ncbi:fatty acid synthase-like [Lutzomyia longipalpis]|uniref:fatty acid synthase-like n=1 Tax=Lutzomyia longipalpis TaxID=7200 RepID=UPI00248416E6|nr:fatty acid synthase-like [Lutzomyia longipalpis]